MRTTSPLNWLLSVGSLLATTAAFAHTLDLNSSTNSEAWRLFQRGRNFEFAQGTNADMSKAAQCYLKAADLGLAQAQFSLARLYIAGEGVRENYQQALRWLRQAAAQDYSPAKNRLGVMYEHGEGVPKDLVEAYKWYLLAAEANNISAIANRDHLAPQLNRRQIAEATNRATALFAGSASAR